MLDFPRWKIASILGVLLVGILLAVPSFIPESTAKQWGLGFAPRINYGLDLAGGSHILLEADTADVAKSRLTNMEDTVRGAMRKNTPAPIAIGDISANGNTLSFFVVGDNLLKGAALNTVQLAELAIERGVVGVAA